MTRPKRPYKRPTLTYLGPVQELTGASGTLPQAEPITIITPKRSP